MKVRASVKKDDPTGSDAEKLENKLRYEQRKKNYDEYMKKRIKIMQERENKKE